MSDESRGWDAINEPLEALYGRSEPRHWGSIIKWRLGGPDPLDGVSAYDAGDHWHYVTYGLTELYSKESELADVSGWGFELTFRLAKGTKTEAPVWPVSMLNNLARYVFKSGNVFEPGHHMDANGPLALDEPTGLTALLFAEDPQLPAVEDGPFGRFELIQLVGIHRDELRATQAWNATGVLGELRRHSRLLVTNLARASYLGDASFRAAVTAGRKKDGASTGALFVDRLAASQSKKRTKRLVVTLGAIAVEPMREILSGRLPFGRPFQLIGHDTTVTLEPGAPGFSRAESGWTVTLDARGTAALIETLAARRGQYAVPGLDGVQFEVVPTEVRDRDGNVTEVIG